MPIPDEMICRCIRCGHSWVKRTDRKPKRCPKCKKPNWDVAPMKRGPKPKAKKLKPPK
jgi:predicted  nucleic acid-binding Zn-ribbon protein